MTASIYLSSAATPASRAETAPDASARADETTLESMHAWIEVDVASLRENAGRLHQRAGVPLVAMVKADAYGLGAVAVARALGATFSDENSAIARTNDVPLWGLGIATIDEARQLRAAGCTSRILCCTPLLRAEFGDAIALSVTPALHVAHDIEQWGTLGGGAWHLAIDTGMARAGVRWDAVAPLRSAVRQYAPEGVFTHFHSAEMPDGTRAQQESRFADARQSLADALPHTLLVHTDNSAAIAARGASDADLVRPGIALYGAQEQPDLPLMQVVHLRARVVDIRDLQAGDGVGYGATFVAAQPRRIATVPVGYADGYRRHLSNRGEVLLNGVRCPVVGRVSMDMTTIDVSDVPCAVGDVVTLMGSSDGVTLTTDDVAARGELSPYELLTGLRMRLSRVYTHASPGAG